MPKSGRSMASADKRPAESKVKLAALAPNPPARATKMHSKAVESSKKGRGAK